MEHYVQRPLTWCESNREDIGKWKSDSVAAAGAEDNSAGDFDCNICLDSVQDPVVTFCGHLYCWPCIYRWIRSHKASSGDPAQQPQCPICKAEVLEDTLIPIYGRGQSGKSSNDKGAQPGPIVPQRPSGPRCDVHTLIAATTTSSSFHPRQQHHHGYQHQNMHPYYSLGNCPASLAFGFSGTTTFHPMIGMFGEMIFARIFGNPQTTLYTYPNTYVATTSSARARWHAMQIDKSLNRVSFFLCCCIVLCLLLF